MHLHRSTSKQAAAVINVQQRETRGCFEYDSNQPPERRLFPSTDHCEPPVGMTGLVRQGYSFKLQKMRQNDWITQLDYLHFCPPDPNTTPNSMP